MIEINNTIIERARIDISVQNELFNYCKGIVTKVTNLYLWQARRVGINRLELESCISDALYIILKKEDYECINFDSYFRKRYEFCLLNLILQNQKYYEKNELYSDIYSEIYFDKVKEPAEEKETKKDARISEILNFVNDNAELFSYNEAALVSLYHVGYNLNEIANYFGWSYNRVKRCFDHTIEKIKEEIGIFSEEKSS